MAITKKNVLLVDDEQYIRKAIIRSLKHLGINIIQAESGEHALQKLKSNKIDLIITDQQMPGMTGLELIAEITKLNLKIPMILISGNLSAKKVPPEIHFLAKPWPDDLLEKTIKKLLS